MGYGRQHVAAANDQSLGCERQSLGVSTRALGGRSDVQVRGCAAVASYRRQVHAEREVTASFCDLPTSKSTLSTTSGVVRHCCAHEEARSR